MLAALSLSGVASADPITRATLRTELSGYEEAPTQATVRQWGTDGAALLMELANDASEAPFLRARSVSALRWFAPNEAVHRFVTLTAASPGDLLVRRAAFDTLVVGFNDLSAVAAHFDAPDADVRDGVAWSLAAANTPASRALLDARLRIEPDENVRRTISTALARTTQRTTTPPVVSVPLLPRLPRARR